MANSRGLAVHSRRFASDGVPDDVDLARSALLHLYDLAYLQGHPLAGWLPEPEDTRRARAAGRRLQQRLIEAIEQLRPGGAATDDHDWRCYRLLTWRYIDGLAAPLVQEKLALSKSEYYRDLQRALAAVVSLLREGRDRPRQEPSGGSDAGARLLVMNAPRNPSPPSEATNRHGHNLPCAVTSFVGRQQEMTTLAALLATTRLLSLTGTGGVGKTRLARELARSVLDRFPDGVWLVELAPLREARLVARAVAVVLDVGETPGRPLLAALVSALRSRRMLLVLDNCEHLLDGCAPVVDALLAGCPDVRVLVTSRQPLGITGDLNWRVPSLASPMALDTDPAQLGRHAAVRLFVDRASAVDPTFALTDQNARPVAQVCRRLDGIPLALELAAARLNALGVEQLAARLDRRFTLLSSGSRTAPPRHQTLRATIDWSYDLLDSLERLLFRRLSVFVGGWTLEAAEAVGAGEGIDAITVLDLLARLVDKSLVLAEEQPDGGRRYRMLETLREYARERLEASGALGAVEACHARYYLCLTNRLEPKLASGRRDAALATLEAEHDNLRRALGWCRDGDGRAVAVGLTIAWNLFWFWYLRGYLLEGFRWAEALLARSSGIAPDIRALALSGAGRMAWLLGEDAAARRRLRECAALWREIGDERGLANALIVLGMETEEPSEAWSQLTQGEATFRADGDTWGLALALRLQGLWAFQHGDEETARARMEEGLALSRQVRDRWFIAQTLNHLGDLARRQADYARAEARYEESLALFRAQGVLGGIPNLLHNLGHVALARGDDARAGQLFQESLRLFQDQGDQRGVAQCLAGLAGVLGARRQPEQAARLLGAAEGLLAAVHGAMGASNRTDHERILGAVRDQLDESTLAAAWAEGRTITMEEAVALAKS